MGWDKKKNQANALALIITVSAPVSVSAKANTCWLSLIHAHSKKPCIGLILLRVLSLKYIVCLNTSLVNSFNYPRVFTRSGILCTRWKKIVDCVMFQRK